MKEFRRLLIVVPATVLVVFLVASFLTRGSMAHMPFLKRGASPGTSGNLVDQRPWQTIESLAPLAVSAEEQSLAREAERLADHEVDQAFALALRQAALRTHTLEERCIERAEAQVDAPGEAAELGETGRRRARIGCRRGDAVPR